MAVFRSVLRVPIDEDHELHVVKEDTSPYLLLSLVHLGEAGVKVRLTLRLKDVDAGSMAKWILGVRDARAHVVRVEREQTQPHTDAEDSEK
jgi:hypothetical protein